MSDCKNIFEYESRTFFSRDSYALEHLSDSLMRLRYAFIRYRREKSFDSFFPINNKIKHSYNKLLWRLKPNLTQITKTNKDYLEARKKIFADYYEFLNDEKRKWNNRKKVKYFGETMYYDVSEIRVHAKKVEVIHVFKPTLEPLQQIVFRKYYEKYINVYVDFCVKNHCFDDKIISKINPQNIPSCNYVSGLGINVLIYLIQLFSHSRNLSDFKLKFKDKQRCNYVFNSKFRI